MFGIKIISEREFNRLYALIKSHEESHKKICENYEQKSRELKRSESDCDSLRLQLNYQMNECQKLKQSNDSFRQFKRDTLEALANIDLGSFRLKVSNAKCDTCRDESPNCRKYTFGSHSFCAIPY